MYMQFKKSLKTLLLIAAFSGVALTATGCSKTVANYKGVKITQEDFYNKVKKSPAGQAILANMIINRTLQQQYGSQVSKKKVNTAYDNARKQYGARFEMVLQQNGMTPEAYKESIQTNLLLQAALKDIKPITKAQEKKAWKEYQPKVRVQHILVEKEDTAKKVIEELGKGASFKDLAKKYSTDTGTSKNAGKIEPFDSSDTTLDADFKEAAFKLKTGEYTKKPVKTQFGYHIIKMIKHPSKGSFQSHKSEIIARIYQKMAQDQNVIKSVLGVVLKRANVNIKDNDLKNVLTQYMDADLKK